jgi:cytoskeletal protein CcmA (bactofilin family)
MSAEDDKAAPRPLPRGETNESEEPEGISAGAFFGLVSEEEDKPVSEDPEKPGKGIGEKAQGKEVLAEGSMAALIEAQAPASLPEKGKMPPNYKEPEKRKKSGDHSSDLEVRCFRCYHIQHVSRFAKSTQCERCSVYISLANYEVSRNQSHTLRTRGDITIAKRGGLKKCEVACHNLTVYGTIDAVVDCSGLAVFRRSGIVRGPVHCRKLVVEKTASVEFPDGILTEQADIQGNVRGDITCSGTVRVARSAEVDGNIRAVSIDMKDGATVSGEARIDPDVTTDLPVKMGFNPSVIG